MVSLSILTGWECWYAYFMQWGMNWRRGTLFGILKPTRATRSETVAFSVHVVIEIKRSGRDNGRGSSNWNYANEHDFV